MILLDPIADGIEEDFTQEQINKIKLRVLAIEAENAAVAKEYLAMKKKPFYHPEHFYEMSAFKYNVKKNCGVEPERTAYVELTDEEYLYLLTKVLTYGSSYRYKHLNNDRPELGRKVIEQLYGSYEDLEKDGLGYHVTFDEVFENAKEIMQLKDYFFPGSPNTSVIFF